MFTRVNLRLHLMVLGDKNVPSPFVLPGIPVDGANGDFENYNDLIFHVRQCVYDKASYAKSPDINIAEILTV